MTTSPGAIDLSLPTDDQLMAAAVPDPRAETARLTATGEPDRITTVARRLADAGPAMDDVHAQSRRAQQVLAQSFANNGQPVYDEPTHWAGLPRGFPDTGTQLYDAGRRLGVVGDELRAATTDVTARLDGLSADLTAWRTAWAAEVDAARGPGGLIPAELAAQLQTRRTDVAAGMREAVTAGGQTIAARIARYDRILNDCVRLMGDAGPVAPTGNAGLGGSQSPVLDGPYFSGLRLEGSTAAPPDLPTPGYTPTPQGPSVLGQPPAPVPVLPGFTPAPPDPGPLITVPAPDLGPYRDTARDREPKRGDPPPNLSPPGAGRSGAFGQAKRDLGIPVGMSPTRVLPNISRQDKLRRGRQYEYDVPLPDDGGEQTLWIRDDAEGDT